MWWLQTLKISWKNLPLFLRYEFFKFFTKTHFFELQKFPSIEKSCAYAYGGSLCVDQVSVRSVKNSMVYGEKTSSSWAPMEPDIYAYRRKKSANGVGVIHSSTTLRYWRYVVVAYIQHIFTENKIKQQTASKQQSNNLPQHAYSTGQQCHAWRDHVTRCHLPVGERWSVTLDILTNFQEYPVQLLDLDRALTELLYIINYNNCLNACYVNCVTVLLPFQSTYDITYQSVKALVANWTLLSDQSRHWEKLYVLHWLQSV